MFNPIPFIEPARRRGLMLEPGKLVVALEDDRIDQLVVIEIRGSNLTNSRDRRAVSVEKKHGRSDPHIAVDCKVTK